MTRRYSGASGKGRRAAAAANAYSLGVGKGLGNPLDLLDKEVAAPTLGGIRNVLSGHPVQDLTPERLTRILRAAENYDADIYYELAEDMEERDPHYAGVLATRKRAVSQLPITIVPADDSPQEEQRAQILHEFFERDTIEDELFDMMDGLGKGISYTEILWDKTVRPWLPCALKTRNQRWFRFDQVDNETPLLKADDGSFQPLPLYKFVVHAPKIKTGVPVRGGLARLLCWTYLFKNYGLKNWVIFSEIYGIPVRVGKYGPSATNTDRRALLQAVQGIGTDAAAIIPASMMIEFVNGMSQGNVECFKEICVYLDLQMSKAILGQTSTTDAVAGGLGGSQASVHNDVRSDVQRADAKQLAATINRDLVKPIYDLNWGAPASGRYPKARIGQAEAWNKDQMAMVESAVSMGADVPESWLLDKIGVPYGEDQIGPDGKPVKMLKASAMTTPQNGETGVRPIQASHEAASARGATTGASELRTQLLGALIGLSGASLASGTAAKPAPDPIDASIEQSAEHWGEVFDPMVTLIEDAVAASTSPDDLRARLLDLADMDQSALTELLARSTFAARLAGEAGLKP